MERPQLAQNNLDRSHRHQERNDMAYVQAGHSRLGHEIATAIRFNSCAGASARRSLLCKLVRPLHACPLAYALAESVPVNVAR